MADKKDDKKKKGKQGPQTDGAEEEKESVGSKVLLVLVTILIIAIWLGIFGILIKFDVGGFGSTVLYPMLKDVPVINRILPNVNDSVDDTESEETHNYDTLDEAIARIMELEVLLDEEQQQNSEYAAEIENLNAQVAELAVYRDEQAEFETLKEKFYEEVVFSDNAPDISEYEAYYASIDPENAEVLYRQVVEQMQTDAEIEQYAAYYSSMKPKNAAAIFDQMTDDLELVAQILQNMSTQAASDILAAMNTENAAKVTEIMNPMD